MTTDTLVLFLKKCKVLRKSTKYLKGPFMSFWRCLEKWLFLKLWRTNEKTTLVNFPNFLKTFSKVFRAFVGRFFPVNFVMESPKLNITFHHKWYNIWDNLFLLTKINWIYKSRKIQKRSFWYFLENCCFESFFENVRKCLEFI